MTHVLEDTTRTQAFSDAIIAIAMTLLILEVHVPAIGDGSSVGVARSLVEVLPHFLSFALSFITLAVIWVNHHTFFHELSGIDGALQWHNNHLMFWVCVIPFGTAFLGEHPFVPGVVALYGLIMTMMAIAFTLMVRHVFFYTDLLPAKVSHAARMQEYHRSWIGVTIYGASVPLAFFMPALSLVLFAITILFYFLPNPFEAHQ